MHDGSDLLTAVRQHERRLLKRRALGTANDSAADLVGQSAAEQPRLPHPPRIRKPRFVAWQNPREIIRFHEQLDELDRCHLLSDIVLELGEYLGNRLATE
jgi:hypothetical protein